MSTYYSKAFCVRCLPTATGREASGRTKCSSAGVANDRSHRHPGRRAPRTGRTGRNDSFVWDEARNLASRRTSATGFKWSVDHIVPLRSEVVSGLHWHANLRVVPFAFNARKGNELAYQDPFSWIANM